MADSNISGAVLLSCYSYCCYCCASEPLPHLAVQSGKQVDTSGIRATCTSRWTVRHNNQFVVVAIRMNICPENYIQRIHPKVERMPVGQIHIPKLESQEWAGFAGFWECFFFLVTWITCNLMAFAAPRRKEKTPSFCQVGFCVSWKKNCITNRQHKKSHRTQSRHLNPGIILSSVHPVFFLDSILTPYCSVHRSQTSLIVLRIEATIGGMGRIMRQTNRSQAITITGNLIK